MTVEIMAFTRDLQLIGGTVVAVVARAGRLYPIGPVVFHVEKYGRLAYLRGRILELEATFDMKLPEEQMISRGHTVTLDWGGGPIVSIVETGTA
jgi:hypothetical protein